MAEQYIGPYRVVREIGRGGMGAVFEAVHPQIERRVGIKVLHPQYAKNEQLVTRFFNEARAVNIVNHPSVVQISEFAQLPDGTAYIVMEYLEGESLGARMKRSGGRLTLAESLRLCRQIAAALAAAHAKGIIHRDLKPDNVMIVSDPEAPGGERAKILDFGIAKLAAAASPGQTAGDPVEAVSQTRTGVMIGTPLYMAPEQCKGSGNIDDKADVYSLGVMLYRMLCGRPPFIGEGAGAVMAMHIYEPPPPIRDIEPSVPEDLANLVHRLLAKPPADRPPMLQVAQYLEQLKALHTTGVIPANELARMSGSMQALTPIPTPAPLGMSGPNGIGPGQISLHQTGVSSVGMSQVHLNQTGHQASASGPNSVSQTFGHSAAQIAVEPRRRGVMVAVATVGASILLGATLFGLIVLRKNDSNPQPERQAVMQPVRKVRFAVSSDPAGATVLRATDQRELGQTPWQSEQPAGSGSLVLILRKQGYADRVVTIDQSANSVVKESLQSLGVTASTPPAPAADDPDAHVRFIRKGGKRIAVQIKSGTAPGSSSTSPDSPPQAVTAANPATPTPSPPTQPPPVKQSPPPSKEDTSHARIQMVD